MNLHKFYMGEAFDVYEYLGAHFTEGGVVFRTFAPAALKVAIIGEFTDWQEIEMDRVKDNFFECTVPNVKEGMMYKFRIYKPDGSFIDHCDPYGFGMELRPHNASIVRDLDCFEFHDEQWMNNRTNRYNEPLNIYELHLGSWKVKSDGSFYTYRELAPLLIDYVKENGYNYVEFLPVSEHPCDESWGYQNTGFFSPTSRYGSCYELMELIDKLHQNGIGVINDFVPVHFAIDDYALANYDGTHLYEYPNNDVGVSEWGSCNFIHSRGEVRSFLQSAADMWLGKFHFDGLRMDAISRIIYWQGDPARGVNGNAVNFLKVMNKGLKQRHGGIMLFAEDSTNFPMVTAPVDDGGLGFDYKWDMGWMNDTLGFFKTAPWERHKHYHRLTFSMMYYYNERYILPLSHDEVVHGKATILQKMYGEYEGKFPQARAFYMYMYAHPGKKLNFMGNEIGQLREWSEKCEQDWDILKFPNHDSFHRFIRDLSRIYLYHPALYKNDFCSDGFSWLDCKSEEKCIYSFERKCEGQRIICVFNFSGQRWEDYELRAEGSNSLTLLLSSDRDIYGGWSAESGKIYTPDNNGNYHFDLSPFTALYLVTEEY